MISALRRGHEGMTEKTTHVVGEGADAITYDVRGDLASATPERPVLMLIGSPMDASGFGTLAGHFTDRPVVTYDPRGAGRNPTDTTPMTPEQHAADLHRVIQALGAGPVDLFATSGGAVNALRLVETHPDDVRRLVAHEPPTAALLSDRDRLLAACEDIVTTYRKAGHGPAMAKFIALVMYDGELPADYLDRPAPDPAMFGMSAEDNGSRDDPLMRNFPACQLYSPTCGTAPRWATGCRRRRRQGVQRGDGRARRAVGGRGGGHPGHGVRGRPRRLPRRRVRPDGRAGRVRGRPARRAGLKRARGRAQEDCLSGARAHRATTSTRASSTSATRAVVTGSRLRVTMREPRGRPGRRRSSPASVARISRVTTTSTRILIVVMSIATSSVVRAGSVLAAASGQPAS